MFQSVFNLVLSISKTHLIVKLETFPHLRRARAGFGWGRGAVRPPRNSRRADGCVVSRVRAILLQEVMPRSPSRTGASLLQTKLFLILYEQ
jgi:hypothetical protein